MTARPRFGVRSCRLVAAFVAALAPLGCDDDPHGPHDAGDAGADVLDDGSDGGGDAADAGWRMCVPDLSAAACSPPPDAASDDAASDDAGIDALAHEDAGAPVAWDPDAVPVDDATFPLGVQAGAMRADSVRLWTQVDPASTSPVLRVWRALGGGDVMLVHDAAATAAEGGYVHVDVLGLAPATEYRYAFFLGSAGPGFTGRSAIGRVKTAFASDQLLKLRFAATTCTGAESAADRAELEPYPALSYMAEWETDLTVHVGDISYNDDAVTLADYREAWATTLGQQGYRDLLSSTGWYATWDDHETKDNWDPETLDPTRIAAARQAFFETLAIEAGAEGQLWRSYRWGATAEFFITDLRSERRPSTLGTADPVFVSDEQLEWLRGALAASPAHFKIVFSSVNISDLPGLWDVDLARDDRWEGYETQRDELLDDIIDNDIENVWFIAGDVHIGMIGRVEPSGPRSRLWEITVGPGASHVNPATALVESGLVACEDVFPCDQFLFGHGRQHAATLIELDPVADTVHVRYVDPMTDEELFDVTLRQERE